MDKRPVKGFSKLSKEEKLRVVAGMVTEGEHFMTDLKSFWHPEKQALFDDFSENTLSNFYLPWGVAPNFLVNDTLYMVPMVIEESSVVAAAAKSANFWLDKGGFRARVVSTTKVGQVHFLWKGPAGKLRKHLPELRKRLVEDTRHITANMEKRGGGIRSIELVDRTSLLENYYQLMAGFETVDSMGANFINSCLEEFAGILSGYISTHPDFTGEEKNCTIVMSILSNYTPDCRVECTLETGIENFEGMDPALRADDFVRKFDLAVQIARIDPYRAVTHNKGIYNGIDAVVLATGNDFRAVEACGHSFAAAGGKYSGLTRLDLSQGTFRYTLTVPLALGTVGGLTRLHPLAARSLELMGNPDAPTLMMIAAAAGLANNFGAIRSLITQGIQAGHMKMHLVNILNHFRANEDEKEQSLQFFKTRTVSFAAVSDFLNQLRNS